MACFIARTSCPLQVLQHSIASSLSRPVLRWRSKLLYAALGRRCVPRSYQTDVHREGHKNGIGGGMLQHEDELPKLPVPSLQETAERYLRSVQPLLSQDAYEKTSQVVNSFIEPSGVGALLQKRLEARRKDPSIENWLAELWDVAAYMGFRQPVVPFTSYFFSFRDDPKRRDPVKRAAAISMAVLEFKKLVDEETLIPDYIKNTPQAMSGYRYLFNSCRIPSKPYDYFETYDPNRHKHILVIRKNRFFKVTHEHQGTQLTSPELEEQFKSVYALAKDDDTHGIGILSTENRDVWADARQRLVESSKANEQALADIQSASFVVCLDDAAPSTLNERSHQYFLGNSSNRWYDKGVNFIVCDSGALGYYGEHSMIDGAPVLRMSNSVLGRTMEDDFDSKEETVRSGLPAPQPITFELTTSNINDIRNAQVHFDDVKRQQKMHVEHFADYGKKFIKSLKCAPDAYVQLVIQLGYKLSAGETRPTYESISTRRFRQGRTEACRVVTNESVAFCDSMVDPHGTNDTRRNLFKSAMNTLTSMQVTASDGKGVDRHLFGLQQLVRKDEEMPAIFTDPAYTYSNTWHITTSQVSSEFCYNYGFAQAIPDGIGIAYMINETSLNFNVASITQDCELVGRFLSQAATNICSLLRSE